jgi:hypothetical protein
MFSQNAGNAISETQIAPPKKTLLDPPLQPYNKPIIDLACSVCTVKYQTSVFCLDLSPSSLGPY